MLWRVNLETLGVRYPGAAPDTLNHWIPTDATFSSRLALVRHFMGWNFKEAAVSCQLPQATWRLWENSGARPRNPFEVCAAIARASGCDYLWLVHGPDRGGAAPSVPDRPRCGGSACKLLKPMQRSMG